MPSFAERAVKARDNGFHGIIIAGDSYGQGSSREHAAICPMYLGIKVVIAMAIERIHEANLINFGIVPLLFESNEDYAKIEQGDEIKITNVRSCLEPEKPIKANVVKPDGSSISISLKHNLSEEDIDIILAGGKLNLK
jgi:aconitate hydratase